MLKNLYPLLFVILLSGCNTVEIKNVTLCAVAGKLSHGAICAESNTEKTYDLTLNEYIIFLEADEATKKGPALAMSSSDFTKMKTALEQACESLGSKCSYETQKVIETMEKMSVQLGLP